MSTVWRLYKGRILLTWLLAAVAGFGGSTWFGIVFDPGQTLSDIWVAILIMGSFTTLVIYLFAARLVIPASARPTPRRSSSSDSDDSFILGKDELSDNLFLYGNYSPAPGPNTTDP